MPPFPLPINPPTPFSSPSNPPLSPYSRYQPPHPIPIPQFHHDSLTLPLHRCHCLDCQKWSGGPCTSNVVVPRNDFKITKGKPKNYNIKGDSGKMNDHWFCGGAFYLPPNAPYPLLSLLSVLFVVFLTPSPALRLPGLWIFIFC